jgi:hypothetical protein
MSRDSIPQAVGTNLFEDGCGSSQLDLADFVGGFDGLAIACRA